MSRLFTELKRRNVFRVAMAYLVISWLVLQVANTLIPLLELSPSVSKTILLILLLGFIPAVFFSWAFEITSEGIKKEKDVVRDDSITNITAKKLDYITLMAAIGLVGMFVSQKLQPPSNVTPAPDTVFPAKAGTQNGDANTMDSRLHGKDGAHKKNDLKTASQEKSIAVLPFINMSSDVEQEYFSDGITEEILNVLAQVKQLRVAGRTSSFAFKGKNDDLRLIGDTLGVAHILEGSVRKSGATIRITAQLIKVEDGFHMWSETYDRELDDVFAIQDEIAAAILEQLKSALLIDVNLASTRTRPEAYELYLQGKQAMYVRSRAAMQLAADVLDKAIAIDPTYAPAYAQRGIAAIMLSDRLFGETPHDEAMSAGKSLLDKSLSLDANLAEAWAGIGLYHNYHKMEFSQAIIALEKALDINPNLINASNWLQIALIKSGDAQGALKILQQITDKDPLYRSGFANAINTYNDFGREADALALIAKVKPLMPDDPMLIYSEAMTHLAYGRSAQAAPLAAAAFQRLPNLGATRFANGAVLKMTHQYEQLVNDGDDFQRVLALTMLKRDDEAMVLAIKLAEDTDIGPLFTLYNRQGQSQKLISYLEAQWPDLRSFEIDHPHDRDGYGLMTDIALAYSRTGNQKRFQEAMKRLSEVIEKLEKQGMHNRFFERNRANYLALNGNKDAALDSLRKAIDMGMREPTPLVKVWPFFESIANDARFIEQEARMLKLINVDRKALNLDEVGL